MGSFEKISGGIGGISRAARGEFPVESGFDAVIRVPIFAPRSRRRAPAQSIPARPLARLRARERAGAAILTPALRPLFSCVFITSIMRKIREKIRLNSSALNYRGYDRCGPTHTRGSAP